MSLKKLFSLVSIGFLALSVGCVHSQPSSVSASSAASPNTRNATPSERNWEYAVLAALAYSTPTLTAPVNFREASQEFTVPDLDAPGFQFKIYERQTGVNAGEQVIAYRGSDEFRLDWIVTNAFGVKKQNKAAIKLFDIVRVGHERVSVTGDSLAGALSTQVSQCRIVFHRLALNVSPRFGDTSCYDGEFGTYQGDKNRGAAFLFEERGQFLRAAGPNATTQSFIRVNCIPGFSPINQHSVEALAICMTLIASKKSDAAFQYLQSNCAAALDIAAKKRFSQSKVRQLNRICAQPAA